MRHALIRHLKRLLLLLAAATGIGWLAGYTLAALLIAVSFYLGSTLVQLGRLHHWLTSSAAGADPRRVLGSGATSLTISIASRNGTSMPATGSRP